MENHQDNLDTNETNQSNEEVQSKPVSQKLEMQALTVTKMSKKYLLETSKWAKFLSIMGFIMIGFMVLGAVFMAFAGAVMPCFDGPSGHMPFLLLSVVYLVIAVVYFFPVFYLFNFSVKAKQALVQVSDLTLESALENLKSHYKFLGISTIVVIGLYILMFIVMLIGGVAFMAMGKPF